MSSPSRAAPARDARPAETLVVGPCGRPIARAFLGEPRQVPELLAVGAVDQRTEDRPDPRLEPERHVVHTLDGLGVHDPRAVTARPDAVPGREGALPLLGP